MPNEDGCNCAYCVGYRNNTTPVVVPATDTTQEMADCARCGTTVPALSLQPVCTSTSYYSRIETSDWCGDCVSEHTNECGECSTLYSDSCGQYEADMDQWLCRSCRGNYVSCEECGTLLHGDDTCHSEDDDNSYCRDCYYDIERKNRSYLVQYYHSGHNNGIRFFDTTDVSRSQSEPKKLYYGIELEVHAYNNLNDSAEVVVSRLGEAHAHLEYDGSVSHGFEIISQPHTLEGHRKLWENFFKRGHGLETSSDTGLHIHISRKKLSTMQIARMVVFVHDAKNASFIGRIAGRRSNSYNERHPKKLAIPGSTYQSRYEAVNLTNSQTIEMRIFASTLSKLEFMARLEFVDALVHFCIDRSYQQLGVPYFCKWMESQRKTYPSLAQFLVSNSYIPALKPKKETERIAA